MEFEERQRKRELKAKLLAEKQQTGANSLPLGERNLLPATLPVPYRSCWALLILLQQRKNLSIHPGRQRDWKRKTQEC